MNSVIDWISAVTGISRLVQGKIISSLIIFFLLGLVRYIVLRIVWRRTESVQQRYRWQKTFTYITVSLGILLIGRIWFEGMQSLATYLGLVTAGVAIALQDIIKSLAGWAFILWRKPIALGDRIQVGSYSGDVIDIRLFKFTMLEIGNWVDADQSTGRLLHLPNSMVLTEVVANYGQGFQFIWNEVPVLLTFESNWEKAKQILSDIVTHHAANLSQTAAKRIKEASKRYMISYQTLTPIVYTTVKESGVLLTLRYLIDPRTRRSSMEGVWEDILREFAKCDDIDFAYPTIRYYQNVTEGKSGVRADLSDKQKKA